MILDDINLLGRKYFAILTATSYGTLLIAIDGDGAYRCEAVSHEKAVCKEKLNRQSDVRMWLERFSWVLKGA